jgi:hypothetical protein
MSWLYFSGCPLLSVPPWLPYPCSHMLIALSRRCCFGSFVLAVLSRPILFCMSFSTCTGQLSCYVFPLPPVCLYRHTYIYIYTHVYTYIDTSLDIYIYIYIYIRTVHPKLDRQNRTGIYKHARARKYEREKSGAQEGESAKAKARKFRPKEERKRVPPGTQKRKREDQEKQ